jgi:hypothetical protein
MAAVIANAYMPHGGEQYLIFIASTSMARPHLIFPNQFSTYSLSALVEFAGRT